ncbi:MAG: ABC transporter permease, partial [Actinomycetota bacterium]
RTSIASDSSGDDLAEPDAQLIEMDFAAARAFGSDPEITGVSGKTPGPGQVVIGEDLAERLEVSSGDELTAHLYGKQLSLEVTDVLPQTGIAGFWIGFESSSPNAFVAPGTIADLLGPNESGTGAAPPISFVLVSNRGGVEDSRSLSLAVTGLIEDELGGTPLRVEEIKRRTLESAERQGEEFGEVFLGIGAFAIIAGILLLVNIFVMLSEERKSQLGMLRAVGMKRSHLVRVFVIEGFIYALLAGLLGAVLGIGVGWAIVTVAAPIFSGFGDFSLNLTFDFQPESLMLGFCLGVLISMATIFGTSLRISRVNIIRAIRDLPEPRVYRARTRSVIIGSVVAAIALTGTIATWGTLEAWPIGIAGVPLVLFGLLPLLSRLIQRRNAVLVASIGTLIWGIFGNAITGGQFFEGGDIFAFVMQGTLLTLAAVLLLSQTQENFEGLIRRVSARSLPLRLSIAYPLARRARTGLTLGMFALVIFTMTFIAVLTTVFGGQVDTATKKEGDFHILATSSSSNPPTEERLESFEGVSEVAVLRFGDVFFDLPDMDEPTPWTISGVDDEFVAGGPPDLVKRVEGLSEGETWQRLLREPDKIIVPSFFLQTGGGPPQQTFEPGEMVDAIDPVTGTRVELEMIGVIENDFAFSGSYVSKETMDGFLGAQAAPARFYIKTDDIGRMGEIAREMQGELVANGVEADPIRTIVEDFQQANLQFFRLMEGYLALGLLVGIAGLGVVMVRAVRERRRDVGVLRSLGFLPHQVRRAFVLESGFVALQGILIGVVLAIITASQLIATDSFGENVDFIVPWGSIAVLTSSALIASLIATAWPAQQASQIPPAVALRIAE